VTQHQADLLKVNAMSQHCAGRCVPKHVRAASRHYDASTPEDALNRNRHSTTGHGRFAGRVVAKKDLIRVDGLGAALQITQQCIAGVLRQRKSYFVASFAHDSDGTVLPIDVVKANVGDIARTQAKT